MQERHLRIVKPLLACQILKFIKWQQEEDWGKTHKAQYIIFTSILDKTNKFGIHRQDHQLLCTTKYSRIKCYTICLKRQVTDISSNPKKAIITTHNLERVIRPFINSERSLTSGKHSPQQRIFPDKFN